MSGKNNNHVFKHTYRLFSGEMERAPDGDCDSAFEFDESDVWNSFDSPVNKPDCNKKSTVPSARATRKDRSGRIGGGAVRSASATAGGKPASLPVCIPDWPRRENSDEEDEEDDGEDKVVPPHEFLARQFARTRIASFSVHEGIGRTLKGRDLSRVRNAIWQKTGFQD
ncbi:hypothetical protein QJS04_geneDACA002433 [Acorus gramineus]|uniref:Senescence regulator n=1 Tax=Acorus gramineus TaxID=55184 RepID=A0AAV9A983_ACOGR|nr:hypothetical protein QJS04_geneDACA002433 [Acorus gramineus]